MKVCGMGILNIAKKYGARPTDERHFMDEVEEYIEKSMTHDAVLGEVLADIETAREPIQNALYATGRFTTKQCDQLTDGILQYIKDAGLFIRKK